MTKKMCVLFVAALALWLTKPAGAGEPKAIPLNDSEEPGSILVFHQFIRGTVLTPDQSTLPVTELEISVTCPPDAKCSEHQPVRLRGHWVCQGGQGFCPATEFDLTTTVNGTLVLDPEGIFVPSEISNPPSLEECDRGYVIVGVIDDTGHPIKFDGLIGNAVIRRDVLPATRAHAYNALPIQAASNLQTGDPTDVDKDGILDFDGTEYQAITGKIFGTVRYDDFDFPRNIETNLTLLTLDVVSNGQNVPTEVALSFFNEEESEKPGSVSFVCWTRRSLSDIDEGLTSEFGRKGLVESTSATQAGQPVTLVGMVDTREIFIQKIAVDASSVCEAFRAQCFAVCAAIPTQPGALCDDICFVCDTVNQTLLHPIELTRDYSYSLYHDSLPVTTTYDPALARPPGNASQAQSVPASTPSTPSSAPGAPAPVPTTLPRLP